MAQSRLEYLFKGYAEDRYTEDERREFISLVQKDDNTEELKRLIEKEIETSITDRTISAARADELFRNIISIQKTPVVRLFLWRRIAAAAVIILLLSIGGYFYFNKIAEKQIAKTETQQQRFKNDISPAKQQVVLLLDNGSKIILDSAANGRLVSGDSAQITKRKGQLLYTSSASLSYNTVSTGKGKNYQLTLADGTQVWLDAMSSIRFPTAFPGEERVVELSGQAYFEVAHNARQPFRVKVGEKVVEVLGTHFNVNAHEETMKTTLLEGAVKILRQAQDDKGIVLKPGEQAQLGSNGQIAVIQNTDLAEVMAWKNGRFKFTGNTVEEIFTELSRWYDIDVVYQDKITGVFVGTISRDVPISKVLDLFEMTNRMKFTIEGKKVVVMK